MNHAQLDGLLDLYLKCKEAATVWVGLAPDRKQQDFTELSEARDMADDLYESGVPESQVFHVLSTTLPAPVFYRTFPAYTGFPTTERR